MHASRHLPVARNADGVKNGNVAFHCLRDDVLKGYGAFVWPFMDDVIVVSGGATYEEAVQNCDKHLRLVLQRPKTRSLRFRPTKPTCSSSKWSLMAMGLVMASSDPSLRGSRA